MGLLQRPLGVAQLRVALAELALELGMVEQYRPEGIDGRPCHQ
jgi:hypothetical protein